MDNKKVVIISGASRGIGAATALKFAGKGYSIVLVGRDVTQLNIVAEQLREAYAAETLVCAGDLADLDFIRSVVEKTVAQLGRIDVLVNNAAWRTIETMRSMTPEIWDKTLKICITAPAFFSKWVAEVMERNQIEGAIVNISSIMSARAAGNSPAYITAKGALESLTKELAVTYGRSKIRVITISPGFIETNMSEDYVNESGDSLTEIMSENLNNHTPLSRSGTPAEVANSIYWVSSAEASFITGCELLIDGGFSQNFSDYKIKHLQFPNEF